MKIQELAKFNLPDSPGVYYFKRGKEILYVGKATSLKDRVESYFSKDILLTRGPKILKMLDDADKVEYKQTDSVLEALILEANEIKKHKPFANTRDKDDKSYNYVVITKEEYPRLLLIRGKNLQSGKIYDLGFKIKESFGPFPNSGELRDALKIIRKIFTFRDAKCKLTGKPCFNAQLGLCPGPCAGWISNKDYRKNIKNIILFFEGRKERLIRSLENEMKVYAKKQEFEEADKIKKQIFALQHIQDVALIKQELTTNNQQQTTFRIEAFDIAHLGGKHTVGVMTVVENGELNKSQYRKFKIKVDKNDDTKNLKEVISRRFAHAEWRFPSLIAVDGGKGQINAARSELDKMGLEMIEVVAVTKDERHRAKEIIPKSYILNPKSERAILLANAEAHRFAINYHRLLRSKGFRI